MRLMIMSGETEMESEPSTKGMLFIVDSPKNYIFEISKEICPQHMSFIATSNENLEVAVDVGKRLRETGLQVRFNYERLDRTDMMTLLHALYKSLSWLKINGLAEREIGVGLTGREERTIATAGIFAGFFGIRSYYYVPGNKLVEDKVLVLANPDDILGFIEVRTGVSHFNIFDYSHARNIFKSLMNKSTSLKSKTLLESLLWLSESYQEWDSFKHYQTQQKIQVCIKRMGECIEELGPEAQNLMKILKGNKDFVSKLSKQLGRKGKTSPLLVLDLCLNGMRRYYEHKCNDAMIRLYRALECSAQHRLLSTCNVKTSSFSKTCHNLERGVLKQFLEEKKLTLPPETIGLNDAMRILKILKDPFAMKVPEDVLKKLMSSRNNCILAHGYSVVKDDTVLEFEREVEEVIRILFAVEKLNYNLEKSKATHLSLDAEILNRFLFG